MGVRGKRDVVIAWTMTVQKCGIVGQSQCLALTGRWLHWSVVLWALQGVQDVSREDFKISFCQIKLSQKLESCICCHMDKTQFLQKFLIVSYVHVGPQCHVFVQSSFSQASRHTLIEPHMPILTEIWIWEQNVTWGMKVR